jgi:transcriptional antiterminator RfaH
MRELWYLARTKPRKEKVLAANLARWDVETFSPYIRRSGAKTSKLESLFPSYIFCKFDATAPSWQAIRWAPGLSYFLTIGDELAVIDESLITYLQAKTQRWNAGAIEARFSAGDRVAIVDGPFSGFTAMFEEYTSTRERCRILVEAVPGISVMEIPDRDLELADGAWRQSFGTNPA